MIYSHLFQLSNLEGGGVVYMYYAFLVSRTFSFSYFDVKYFNLFFFLSILEVFSYLLFVATFSYFICYLFMLFVYLFIYYYFYLWIFYFIFYFYFFAVIKLGCFLPTVRWCAPSLTFRHVPALFSSSLVHFFFKWSLLKLYDTHIIKQNLILQNCKKDSIHLQTDGCPSQNQQGQRRNYFMNTYQQVSKIKPEYIFLNPFIKIIFFNVSENDELLSSYKFYFMLQNEHDWI